MISGGLAVGLHKAIYQNGHVPLVLPVDSLPKCR